MARDEAAPPVEQLGAFWDLALEMLAIVDLDTRMFRYLNTAWEEATGWTRDELQAEPFIEFVHPDDRERTLEEAGAMVEESVDSIAFENRYRKKEGGWLWLRWHSRMGNDHLAYAVAGDVTAAKRAAAFLHVYGEVARVANAAANLEEALKRTLDVVCDVLDWPVGHVYRPEDGRLVPTDIWHLGNGDFPELRSATDSTVFRPGEGPVGHVFETREPLWIPDLEADPRSIRTRGGDLGVHGALVFPVMTDGEVAAVLEFFSKESVDIDEEVLGVADDVGAVLGQVVMRDRIRRAEAEAIDTERRYLSMASHELRSPLTNIKGFADLLTSRWVDFDDKTRIDFTEKIRENSQQLVTIVETFLDNTRARVEGFVPRFETFSLGEAVATAVGLAGESGAAISVDVDAGVMVRADQDFVQQILVNLLSNAGKYGEPPYEITAEAEDSHVEVAVRDHGSGVPEDFEPQLFKIFSRADRSSAEGAGLGLSICRDLARAQHGDLRFEAADPGARFVVRLMAVGPDGT